jgi:hypothetical protein
MSAKRSLPGRSHRGHRRTAAIQLAIDHAGAAGGGTVYLPAGTYAVAPQGGNDYALRIRYSRVVLRGAGPGITIVHNTATDMRQKEVIKVRPSAGDWRDALPGTSVVLTGDLLRPTVTLPIADASSSRQATTWWSAPTPPPASSPNTG